MNMANSQVPILEGLFTEGPDGPRLVGGRCRGCDSRFFPATWETHDPACERREIEEIPLSRRGRLASYTVHRFQAPPPFRMAPFRPYAIGAVELPERLLVIGMLTGVDVESIRVGADVELVLGRLYTDQDGNDVVTYMWRVTAE